MPTQPDSIPEQMSQIDDVVTKKPDAIVMVPVDHKAMVGIHEVIEAATASIASGHREIIRTRH
jgi:ribose transport system substrate-binding protein